MIIIGRKLQMLTKDWQETSFYSNNIPRKAFKGGSLSKILNHKNGNVPGMTKVWIHKNLLLVEMKGNNKQNRIIIISGI